jgi:hypothetical protein
MKSFKQFLIEQEIPDFIPVGPDGRTPIRPGTKRPKQEIKQKAQSGEYTTTYMKALIQRLGSKEAAEKYISDLKERRRTHGQLINPKWVLPSLEDEDLNKSVNVSLNPNVDPTQRGVTPITIKRNRDYTVRDVITDPGRSDIEINVNSSFSGLPETIGAEEELKTGKRDRSKHKMHDTLWHEFQHILQRKNMIGRKDEDVSTMEDETKWPGGINYDVKTNTPNYSVYMTSNVELPAHLSELKARYRDQSGVQIGPKSNDKEMAGFKSWIKQNINTNDQFNIADQLLNDPKRSKQVEELLKQIAKNNSNTDINYA